MTERNRILVLGGLNVDLIIRTPRMPQWGECLVAGAFAMAPGGKAGNQAVACAKLAGPKTETRLVGCVGDGQYGQYLLDSLQANGVDTALVRRVHSTHTGIAFVILNEQGDYGALVSLGANSACSTEEIDAIRQNLPQTAVLLTQIEMSLDVIEEAVAAARSQGVCVLLDPAPIKEIPSSLLSQVDVVLPNQIEAEVLSGVAVKDPPCARRAAQLILARGPREVVVKVGGQGALYLSHERELFVPGIQVNVVDATAAGDAFAAGFAVGRCWGYSIEETMALANQAGALAVTKLGAQTSMPTLAEVRAAFPGGCCKS